MTDDTLVNGLKAIFGTSAQGSAPASSALIPYMDASGNPVGLSSMANLASVLGAAIVKDIGYSGANGGYCLLTIGANSIAELYILDNSSDGYRKYLAMCRENRSIGKYLIAGAEGTDRDSSIEGNGTIKINLPSWTHVYVRYVANESAISTQIVSL